MLETDLHDLSDDADYAASQQHGSYSIMRSESGSRNSSGDSDGAEIIYFKDNVAIHPTQFASERINGRLKLIKKGSLLFMTWIPSSGHNPAAMLSEGDKKMYTIRAVPFSDIRSIHRHAPTFGWKYIIVVLSSGLAFAPLYFYSGGIKEFLAAIKQHIFITRSSKDPNVFLVNDFEDRLQRTLSSLELPHTISIANNSHYSGGDILAAPHVGRQRHKSNDPARDLSIQVLEKFSLVTKFARETTSQLFRDSHNTEFSSFEDEAKGRSSSFVDKSVKEYHDEENIHVESSVVPDPLDFDKLTLVWGKPRKTPLAVEEWETFLDGEGRVVDSKDLKKRIFYGGVDHGLRKEVWPFLLGYLSFDSTFAEREYLLAVKKSEYNTIKSQWESISPEQAKRFTKFRERKGLIDKDVVRTDRSLSFYDGDDNENVNLLHDILLTYSFYNFDLGYCQGMSDLLAPILFVIKDESIAFWCFDSLMKRLGPNFNRDQSGMHSQLFALSKLVELLDLPLHNYLKKNDCLNYFFCFRWVLIQFKREFEYEEMMRLWEILWTHHLSEHLHLYVCVSILKQHRRKIMGEQMDFDTLLKFINDLSGHIHLDSTLRDAEALCICAGENGSASIPPGTPPSLPETELLLPFAPQQHDDDDDIL